MRSLYSNYNFIYDEGKIWFVSNYFSILCCYSLDEKKLIKAVYLNSGDKRELAYSGIAKKDNQLYVFPANASYIVMYNIADGYVTYTEMEETICNKFMSSCVIGNNIYAFPGNSQDFLCISDEGKNSSIPFVVPYEKESNINRLQNCIRCKDNKVYFLSTFSNEIIVLDTSDNTINSIRVGSPDDRFSAFDFADDEVILGREDGNVMVVDLKSGNERLVINPVKDFTSHRYDLERAVFTDIVYFGTCAYLFPGQSNMILRLELEDDSLERIDFEFDDKLVKGELSSLVKVIDGDRILFFRLDNYKLCDFDLTSGKIVEYDIPLSDGIALLNSELKELLLEYKIINEGEFITLEDYLKVI